MIFLQLLANHIVKGEVRSSELDNDMVGPTIANTRIRANVYKTEDDNWKEVKVRTTRVRMTMVVIGKSYSFYFVCRSQLPTALVFSELTSRRTTE